MATEISRLKDRLNVRAVHRSGTVHSAYLCDGIGWRGEPCDLGVHPFCYLQRRGGRLALTDEPVTCKRCLSGGSAWAALVNSLEHRELSALMGYEDEVVGVN